MVRDPLGDNEYLTRVETLARLVAQGAVRPVDVREPEEYQAGHIPGAVNIYEIFTYLATRENGGYEAMASTFSRLFGEAGLDGTERVVVYEDAMDSGYGRSCRGRFLLQWLGHPRATVLHGGFQAWMALGQPLVQGPEVVQPKVFEARPDASIMLSAEEMLAALSDASILKLDVRDHSEWVGVSSSPYGPEFAPRKGRIPGAIWIEWYRLMRMDDGIPWLRTPDELRAIFAEAGITPDRTVYTYCFKGARTSLAFMALKMAGIHRVRNYFGSWNDWSRDPALPIETGYPRRA